MTPTELCSPFLSYVLTISGLVGKLNPKNKVDLTNPELTIIVEVIKAVCCISVVKDYRLYRKYNVQEVVKEDTPKASVTTTETEQVETKEEKDEEDGDNKKVPEDNKMVDKDGCNGNQ